ncbi:hypothetical protein A7982_12067 [Minicystis rosea]|nr:hypothetical protein A7982_12067 [Minicystis rosea]
MLRSTQRALLLPILLGASCAPEATSPTAMPPEKTVALAPPLPVVPGVCGAGEDAPEVPAEYKRSFGDDRNAKWRRGNLKDACDVADANVARTAEEVLKAPRGRAGEAATSAWDHRQAPRHLDEVSRRFALGKAERALLDKNGFVVPAGLTFSSYTAAFHEIHQSEMPLYVSVDSVLHAVFRGNDSVASMLEQRRLAPLLARTLAAMHCALPRAASEYPEETARDLDVYLTVARSLLAEKEVPAVFQGDAGLAALLAGEARKAEKMSTVDLFGRSRRIDFTQYTPRGHYATEGSNLQGYFRAAMWLSRLELNLVSRSSRSSAASDVADPRETPREAVDALALADLATRADAMEGVKALEQTFATFAGKREDVSLAELTALRARAGISSLKEPRVFERLKEAIGDGHQRTTRIHYMPEGSTVLPAISTFIGPRIVADSTATQPLVSPQTRGRHVVGAADMAYALGQDRARAHLRAEIDRFPDLSARLDEARAVAHAPHAGEDLYGLWYRAILGLADRPAGALPSFMNGEPFADLRLGSTIAAYGQLRHNAVLFAGQSYDEGGCEIPDAFVEPAPAVYDALITYAERGATAVSAIDPENVSFATSYFTSLARTLRVLSAISRDELSGKPLSEEARRFLSMVVEMRPGSSGGPPTFTGWYFDLFPSVHDALARADFVADYFTSGEAQTVSYAGASAPRLGIFVVDVGGPPRVVVGPVARGYEVHAPLAKRLDDDAASKLAKVDDPWAASYTAPAPAAPDLSVSVSADEQSGLPVAIVEPRRAVGAVTVELLDHHRRRIQSITQSVGARKTRFVFKAIPGDRPMEALHVVAGGAHAWADGHWYGTTLEMGKGAEPAADAKP